MLCCRVLERCRRCQERKQSRDLVNASCWLRKTGGYEARAPDETSVSLDRATGAGFQKDLGLCRNRRKFITDCSGFFA